MSSLIENLLKVEATDHREIQEEIRRNFRELGYDVELEKKIWAGRKGKIDVFARKGDFLFQKTWHSRMPSQRQLLIYGLNLVE